MNLLEIVRELDRLLLVARATKDPDAWAAYLELRAIADKRFGFDRAAWERTKSPQHGDAYLTARTRMKAELKRMTDCGGASTQSTVPLHDGWDWKKIKEQTR